MLSYRRALQSLQAQPHAGHPGSHHPGDRSLLLSWDHRSTICPRPELRHTDHHRDGHFHTDLYKDANYHHDSDSYLDLHPIEHPFAYRLSDGQRNTYILLDSDPHSHFHTKRNPDTDILTNTDANINFYTTTDIDFHADFHFHRNPHPANPHRHSDTLILPTFPQFQ